VSRFKKYQLEQIALPVHTRLVECDIPANDDNGAAALSLQLNDDDGNDSDLDFMDSAIDAQLTQRADIPQI